MSWLTDPDEEWSTDTPSRGRGPAADPADYPTAPHRPVPAAAEPPPPAGAPRPPAGYRDARNEPPGGYPGEQAAPGYRPAGERPAQPGGRPGYSAIPAGLWAGEGASQEDPGEGWHDFADYGEEPPRRSRLGLIAAIVVAWLVVSIAVLGFLLLFRGGPKSNHTAATSASSPAAPSSTGGALAPKPTAALPAGWVKQASDSQTNCAAHSYGQVQGFLAKTPCSSMQRLLATTTQNGRQIIIASYVIHFATPSQAASFNSLVTTDGTGDVTNLLAEGNRIPGGPSKLPDAAFASRQTGNSVSVAEAAYAAGSSNGSDPTLKSVASQGIPG